MRAFRFDNRFLNELPGDPEVGDRRRPVHKAGWSRVTPTPVAEPRLLAYSREMAERLGFSGEDLASDWFPRVFAGNELMPGMDPFAACYGGHQFGQWAGQLGDGRAISLGEVVNDAGERWELQLKGAGPTPYSRHADGRAVLRSSIREFLCSEAMHHLGVPTTRALSLVATGEDVMRDMFYDGRPRPEPGAVVCRVAPSFIRFGNFEIFAARGDTETLSKLVDFTIARDYPHLDGDAAERRAAWFREVCTRTATMVAHWMRVGFVHGVMNTDNMSILGLTIDYGPYGWTDNFDLNWTPNTTDAAGRRYRFGFQPRVAQWNLVKLAEALRHLMEAEPLEAGLEAFAATYNEQAQAMTAAKLGFREWRADDETLVGDLHKLMALSETDMTIFFRDLASLDLAAPSLAPLQGAFYDPDLLAAHEAAWQEWLQRYAARANEDAEAAEVRRARMNAVNPRFVLRNYLAQQVIDRAEAGDPSGIPELLEVLRRPYDEQPQYAHLAARRPDWARNRPGCSTLSCSS
ncbi:MAG TPA: YdiU family protein [Deinococcales bacterium]|nr:YdiU family protein [Deinococcales bacterium]